jgi:putative sterol carrier protein
MSDPMVNDFARRMTDAFIPEKAAGVDADIQFNLSGDHAGQYFVSIKDKTCTLHEGTVAKPKLTITANSEDLLSLYGGQLDPMQAFLQGKIKIAGDMSLAMKLMSMFKMK